MNAKDKKIVHLDHSTLSNLKLALEDRNFPRKDQFKSLLQLLEDKVSNNQIVCPGNPIHLLEAEADNEFLVSKQEMDKQRFLLKRLGNIYFIPPQHVIFYEFFTYLLNFINGDNLNIYQLRELLKKLVFYEDIDLPNSEFKGKHELCMPYSKNSKKVIHTLKETHKDKSVEEIYELEVAAKRKYFIDLVRGDLYSNVSYKDVLEKCYKNIDVNQVIDFIRSDNFEIIPSINLFCRLHAANAKQATSYEKSTGDIYDIEYIASYLFYSDYFICDKRMAELLKQRDLDKNPLCYTEVFSMSREGVTQLMSELNK